MRKIVSLLTVLMLFCTLAFAQQRTVTGQVRDANGAPVPFATVTESGTRNAVQADANGNFTIKVPENARLSISSAGFQSQTVTLGNASTITLTRSEGQLQEVVVTGLGRATERRKVPIDVASVNANNFAKTTTTSIEQGLVGQIAGAQIQQTSGQAGAGFNIILRGITNLGGSQPMILVDGVEVTDMSSLDPSNVERVEVVKGAAGGMLYGAQGANGVIQIFTKKGSRNGRLNINVNSKVSIDNVLRGNDLVSQYHHYVTDANGNILDANGSILKRDALGYWPDPQEDLSVNSQNNKTYNLPVYDHLKQGFRQAITYTNSVSLTGGANNFDYAFVASRLDQQDVFSNNFSRNNLSLNLGIELFKGFTFRTTTQAILGKEDLLGGNRFSIVNSYPWIDFTFRDASGHLVLKPKDENQLNSLSEREWHERYNKSTRLVQNFNFNYKFPKFVELDYKYGIDYTFNDGFNYYHNQLSALQQDLHWGSDPKGSITNGYNKYTFQNSLASVYLRTDFQNDFHSSLPIRTITQVSYDYRKNDYRSFYAQGVQLPSYPPYNVSVANTKTSGDASSAFTTFGVLFNQTVEYGNLFGISAGLRSDYSSEFGAGSNAFTFPRGTIFFNPSELFSSHNLISNWKLRAAYGEAGIQPDRFARQVTLDVATLGNSVSLSLPTTAKNPNLAVQRSKELEVGTDITLNPFQGSWFNRASFSGTYWKRRSEDVIQNADVAISTGFGSRTDNLSTLESNGVDLSLDANAFSSKNFDWNLGLRFGVASSKVVSIANHQDVIVGEFSLKEGQKVGTFYGQVPVTSLTQLNPNSKLPYIDPSQAQFYTIVNGMVVDTRTNKVVITGSDDQYALGNAYPDFTASMINTLSFKKNLTLSFQFDWVHGNSIYNLTRQWLYRDRLSKDFDQPVTIGNQTGAFVNYYNSLYNSVSPISWFVEDGSFIRLRDLSLTYDLTSAIHKAWLKKLSVTVAGRNLLTFTNYKGLDPENTTAVDSQGNGSSGVGAFKGVDYFGIPNLRSLQFSINLGF